MQMSMLARLGLRYWARALSVRLYQPAATPQNSKKESRRTLMHVYASFTTAMISPTLPT